MTGVAAARSQQYFPSSSSGPLVGGTVDVYLAGTTTRANTWQDRAMTTLNTNPIVLNARGECSIWLDPGTTYKFVVKDSLGVTQYTEDNVQGSSGGGDGLSFKGRGADSTGAVDSSSVIVDTFTAGQSGNIPVSVAGEYYKITSPVLLPYHVAADFGQATIDATGIAAGQYAITAKNKSGLTNYQRPSMWKGLDLNLGSSGAYGVKIEAPTGQWAVSDFAAETWRIKGGARGIGFGQNTWLVNFRNIEVTGQSAVGVYGVSGSNSGEGISFYGGVIANVTNGGATGIGFLQDYDAGDPGGGTFKFFGTSFDYSDVQIHHRHGSLELHGCHIEASGALPMAKVEQVVGRAAINFSSFGSTWVNNPASTRTAVVQVTGSAVVNIHGGECNAIGNTEGLEFVSVVAGSSPTVDIRGVSFNLFPGISQNIGRICGYTSLVRNGDFETGTLDSWAMDAVNFVRNGAFIGGVDGTIGAGAAWPTNMALIGSLNGLNQPVLTFTTTNGKPVMRVRFTGTPTSTASTGIYFDNTSNIATAQGDLWTLRAYMRTVGAATGVTAYSLLVTERDGGGAAVGSGSTAASVGQVRTMFSHNATVAQATAAYLQLGMNFSYTNGVPVDVTLEIDTPSLMLRPMIYEDILRSDVAATLATYRVALDSTNGRTAAKCLKFYSTSAQTADIYVRVPVKSRQWLVARGYANITSRTAGEVGLKLSWRDGFGSEISTQNVRTTYLSTTGSYLQQSGCRVAPNGAEYARVGCHLEAFNGTVLFDDVEAWVI